MNFGSTLVLSVTSFYSFRLTSIELNLIKFHRVNQIKYSVEILCNLLVQDVTNNGDVISDDIHFEILFR